MVILSCTSALGARDEVVEHVLLLLEHPGLVPGLALLAPPRRIALTQTPPRPAASARALNAGVWLMLKPP